MRARQPFGAPLRTRPSTPLRLRPGAGIVPVHRPYHGSQPRRSRTLGAGADCTAHRVTGRAGIARREPERGCVSLLAYNFNTWPLATALANFQRRPWGISLPTPPTLWVLLVIGLASIADLPGIDSGSHVESGSATEICRPRD